MSDIDNFQIKRFYVSSSEVGIYDHVTQSFSASTDLNTLNNSTNIDTLPLKVPREDISTFLYQLSSYNQVFQQQGCLFPYNSNVSYADKALILNNTSHLYQSKQSSNTSALTDNTAWNYVVNIENIANKNYINNGGFQVWQRGSSLTYSGGDPIFCGDFWFARRGAFAPNLTLTRQESDLAGFKYFLRAQITAGDTSTAEIAIGQIIDSRTVRYLAGQDVTLSCWVRLGADYADSTDNKVELRIRTSTTEYEQGSTNSESNLKNPFGLSSLAHSGGDPASTTDKDVWQQIVVNYTIPSDAQTLLISLRSGSFSTSAKGSDFYVDSTGAKLEIGETASSFISNTYEHEKTIAQNEYDPRLQVIPTNTFKLSYIDSDTLQVSSGLCNSGDNTQYINAPSANNIDFSTTGVGGLSTNTTRAVNTWYYIFICIKADNTIGVIADERSDGSDAAIDFTNSGYLDNTMKFLGVWRTEDSTTNIWSDFKQIETGLKPKYKLLSPSQIDYFFTSAGSLLATNITFNTPINAIISGCLGVIADVFDLYGTDENNTISVKTTVTNTAGRIPITGPGNVNTTQFNPFYNLKLDSNAEAVIEGGATDLDVVVQIRTIELDLNDF